MTPGKSKSRPRHSQTSIRMAPPELAPAGLFFGPHTEQRVRARNWRGMRYITAAVVLVLLACSQQGEPPPPVPSSTERPASAPLDPIATLEGEWRVAGIDGTSFDEPYGLALSASRDEIWWEPRCAGQARRYSIDGLGFIAEPARSERAQRAPDSPPPPICAVGLPPRLADVVRAISQADMIGRTRENGILISGPQHSVLLYSQ